MTEKGKDQKKKNKGCAGELDKLQQRVSELEKVAATRQQVERELRERARQQAVVAGLGQRVLAGIDLSTLLEEVTARVAETLGVEYCQILELLPDRDALLLRAGVGWPQRLLGHSTVDARPDSQLGYTLFSSEPVIVEDLRLDTRFSELSLLEYNIVSGMSVIIDGEEWPFGVLGIHTSRRRIFTQDDIHFLQAVANLLATAIQHKRAQQALQEAHDKLEARVRERTADLQAANEELKTFAYMVSHDLRAPLVNIKGFAGELSIALETIHRAFREVLPHLSEEQQQAILAAFVQDIPEALGFINSSVNRMNDFINAILKLSRMGRRELNLEPLDAEALVQATLETLAHQIEQCGAKVTVNPLPVIVADRTSMEQIFSNILTNAISYLGPDRPGEIEVFGERNETETIFRVRDNGCGIAKKDIGKIFELFRRVGNLDVPGEGMGLAYVRALVRRCGGHIWCESRLGVGSTFSFTIPHHLEEGGTDV
ncbi:MAG: GAF domain-containing protein [Anaerolineae bacterium]|nr:GAF domain-containing protein [Anaerolineae bacterium]